MENTGIIKIKKKELLWTGHWNLELWVAATAGTVCIGPDIALSTMSGYLQVTAEGCLTGIGEKDVRLRMHWLLKCIAVKNLKIRKM